MFTSANVARKEDDDSRDYFTEESTASVCFRYYLCSVFGNCETVGQMKYRNDESGGDCDERVYQRSQSIYAAVGACSGWRAESV